MGLPLALLLLAGTASGESAHRSWEGVPATATSPRQTAAVGYASVTILQAVEVGSDRPSPTGSLPPRALLVSTPGGGTQRVIAYEFE